MFANFFEFYLDFDGIFFGIANFCEFRPPVDGMPTEWAFEHTWVCFGGEHSIQAKHAEFGPTVERTTVSNFDENARADINAIAIFIQSIEDYIWLVFIVFRELVRQYVVVGIVEVND